MKKIQAIIQFLFLLVKAIRLFGVAVDWFDGI